MRPGVEPSGVLVRARGHVRGLREHRLRFPDRTQLPRTRQADLWINKRQRVIERAKDTLNVVAEIPEDSGGIRPGTMKSSRTAWKWPA